MSRPNKYLAIEVDWNGIPPVPMRLRQIGRNLSKLDGDHVWLPENMGEQPLRPEHVTTEGVKFWWYKSSKTPKDGAQVVHDLIAEVHPCRVRALGFSGDYETWPEDPWAELAKAPWS